MGIVILLVIGVLVALGVFGAFFIKQSNLLDKQIKRVRELAEEAKTQEELHKAWIELVEVDKKCWHRTDSGRTQVIATIIRTKQQFL